MKPAKSAKCRLIVLLFSVDVIRGLASSTQDKKTNLIRDGQCCIKNLKEQDILQQSSPEMESL